MLRVLDEFLWVLRREGLLVSTAQAIDAARVTALARFFGSNDALRAGLAPVLATTKRELALVSRDLRRFFSSERAHLGDLWGRLRARGFRDEELGALRELLDAAAQRASGDAAGFLALTGDAIELDQMLAAAGIARALAPMSSAMSVGFFTQEVGKRLGLPALGSALARMKDALREALGDERGAALAAALREELDAMKRRVRAHVEQTLARKLGERGRAGRARGRQALLVALARGGRGGSSRRSTPRRAAARRRAGAAQAKRSAAASIRTARSAAACAPAASLSARRAACGAATSRGSSSSATCRDSVRAASRFMLEFVHASQELFSGTRSFVFVSDVGETTELFAAADPRRPRSRAHRRRARRDRARQLELRPRARGLRGAPRARRRSAHDGRDPRRRADELFRPTRARRRRAARASGPGGALDLPGARPRPGAPATARCPVTRRRRRRVLVGPDRA